MLTANIKDINEIVEKIKTHDVNSDITDNLSDEVKILGDGKIEIAVINYGVKKSVIESLLNKDCKITIYPSKLEEIDTSKFDGIVLSNGPR